MCKIEFNTYFLFPFSSKALANNNKSVAAAEAAAILERIVADALPRCADALEALLSSGAVVKIPIGMMLERARLVRLLHVLR